LFLLQPSLGAHELAFSLAIRYILLRSNYSIVYVELSFLSPVAAIILLRG